MARLILLIPDSLQSLSDPQALCKSYFSLFSHPSLRSCIKCFAHTHLPLHRTVHPRASLLFSVLYFSFFSPLILFVLYYDLLSFTQNAFLHKTLSSTPHPCPRRRPASTSRERLVRSMHPRKMLLGPACRVWLLGVNEDCQSYLLISSTSLFWPTLTSYTYSHLVGPCQCDFGHNACHWLANYDELRPD